MPLSLSARRAWIEIEAVTPMQIGIMVALRKESVDRNCALLRAVGSLTVALRKESVDRNICCHLLNIPAGKVALRKESVDRNRIIAKEYDWDARSLSARRAWIEILIFNFCRLHYNVALRKESVDRNTFCLAAGNQVI